MVSLRAAQNEAATGTIVSRGVVKAFNNIKAQKPFVILSKNFLLTASTLPVGQPWLIVFENE